MATNIPSASSSSPLLPQEQALLETYFTSLSEFAYDKAKDYMDREKDGRRTPPGSMWASLMNALSLLAMAEKTYTSLTFLGQKWFGRRDQSKSNYAMALTDIRRVKERGRHASSLGMSGTPAPLDRLLSHLCEQLEHYIEARKDMMDLYEQCGLLDGKKFDVNFADQTAKKVSDIITKHAKRFHHPILSAIRNSLSLELEALHALLESQLNMSSWRFLPSLLNLKESHSKLEQWGAPLKLKEIKKKLYSASPSKSVGIPPLVCWFVRFHGAQLSKFSFYFHDTLSKQVVAGDMKTHIGKLPVEYYAKVVAFQKRSDAFNISLVFDTHGSEETYKGHGYHHPESIVEPPKGLDSYPAVFSYPNERPSILWPNVVMLLTQGTPFFCDKVQQKTYYITKVDVKMNLVVIFDSKKSEKDTHTNNFLNEMGGLLRGNKTFASLRQGAKT
ncbi:KICSTOR subunit 2-like [Amphiura filiformis]|uniref:KICSTOR subunit 2-like n=1 Tax=Amphiura filiformis TaxID=82378 RepID=UPI003B21BD78